VAIAEDRAAGQSFMASIDAIFSQIVAAIFSVLFFSIGGFPLIVLWLIGGGGILHDRDEFYQSEGV